MVGLENLKMRNLSPKSSINQTLKYRTQSSIATCSIYSLNQVAHIHPPAQYIIVAQTNNQDLYQSKISTRMSRRPCMSLVEQIMTSGAANCGAAEEGARAVGKIIGTAEATALKQHLYSHLAKSTNLRFPLSS